MYICPECGEKLDKNATICPCCGRGNKENRNNKYDFVLIVVGLIVFSIGLITSVSFAYEGKKIIYNGVNYNFSYDNNYWISSEKYKALDENSDILVFNSDDNIYIQFDKEMIDLGFDVDVDSARDDLYKNLYKELVSSGREYSNVSASFERIGEKYYMEANYNNNKVKARMFVLGYRTKVMTFYIVHDGKNYSDAEEKLLDIFKSLEMK